MGVRVENGQTADSLPQAPWADADPRVMVVQLSQQLASAYVEMAAMRTYIDQLHQALAVAVPQEEHVQGVG